MVFIKFVRILVGVIVLWLLLRLLFPRSKTQRLVGSRRKSERHRKFVESSVIRDEEGTGPKTGP